MTMGKSFAECIGGGLLRFVWNLQHKSFLGRLKHMGKSTSFHGWIEISSPECVSIGDGVSLHSAFIQGEGGVTIGDYVHFGKEIRIYSSNHRFEGGTALPYDATVVKKPVSIGNYAWIGANVLIAPGANIGEGAVVGLGAVVTRDIPPMAIAGGNPAQVIRYRDKEEYERLKAAKAFQ
jgi:acetyltransferase-like isoleucine patch superfamily enzyme